MLPPQHGAPLYLSLSRRGTGGINDLMDPL